MFDIMMFLMEIYAVFIIAMMTAALELQQSCVNYCKITSNQESSISRHDCDCIEISQHNLSTISEASYESKISETDIEHKLNNTDLTQLEEKSFNSFISKSVENENYNLNSNETLSRTGENNFNNSSFEKYNSKHDNSSKPSKNIEFPIYLDVSLYRQGNASKPNMKEELINIFEKIRASEKDLSQCVNLQVYIFSKTDTQDDTNGGREGNQDKLSKSEILTEIHNKCDQRNTVIHESIYEIRQRDQKDYDSSQKNQESIENSSIYEADDTEDNRTIEDELSRTSHNSYQDSTNLENNDLIETTTISLELIDEGYIDRHGMDNHVPSLRFGPSAKTQSDEEYSNFNMTFNRTRAPEAVSHIEIRDSVQHKGRTRGIYSEKEILIPKIITKELSNNTIISIIDGYEIIPNSDFVLNYYDIARTGNSIFSSNETNASQQSEQSNISDINNGNNTQSDVMQDLQGNFYFLFDNSQIPARFIQNSEGEMQLAVDGYSLCDQTVQREDNQINFKNLLCSCIKFHHCSL